MPRSLRCTTRPRISLSAIGSMPANGSSRKMNCGLQASARAISTRRRSPPESATAGVSPDVLDGKLLEQRLQDRLAPLAEGLPPPRARRGCCLRRSGRGTPTAPATDSRCRGVPGGTSAGGDVAAVEGDAAFVRRQQAGDHVEAGGLAGAVRPQQAHHLAALQRQADTADHRPAAVALAEIDREQAAVAATGADAALRASSPLPERLPRYRMFIVTPVVCASRTLTGAWWHSAGSLPLTLPPCGIRAGKHPADPGPQVHLATAAIQLVAPLDDLHRSVQGGDAAIDIVGAMVGVGCLRWA